MGLCGESLLQSSSFESHSPGFSGSSNGVGGASEISKVAVEQSECKNDFLDSRKVTHDLHGTLRNISSQTSTEDGICNSLDMKHLNRFDNDPPLLDSVVSCKKKSSADTCQTASVRGKRCRKPTVRYIEEFSKLRSREKVSNSATKGKHPSLASHHKPRHVRFKALRHIPANGSNGQMSDMALPELQVHKKCLKNEVLILTCVLGLELASLFYPLAFAPCI